MKKLQKPLMLAGIITAVGAAGLVGGSAVVNAATQANGSDPMSSLASKIAQKFNLKEADVLNVFDEQRSTMEAQREQQVKDQVAQLVKDDKLTQQQADMINTKRTELDKERDANRTADQSLSATERESKREERKTEIDNWLKDNGIDSQYTYLLGMGGHGREHGGLGSKVGHMGGMMGE